MFKFIRSFRNETARAKRNWLDQELKYNWITWRLEWCSGRKYNWLEDEYVRTVHLYNNSYFFPYLYELSRQLQLVNHMGAIQACIQK